MQKTTHIAVVIPLFNGAQYIDACLQSLAAQTPAPDQIVVVDDASSDDGPVIAAAAPGVRVIRQQANFGYAHTINTGIAALRHAGETNGFVFLLNQDTALNAGCLAALAAAFEADPQLGVAGCKIFYPDQKTLQHAGGYLDRPAATAHHAGQHDADVGQHDLRTSPEFVTGAAMAISCKALDILGGMDEAISRAYFEDIDLCFRARAAGFNVSYEPAATLTHIESSVIPQSSYVQALNYHTGRVQFALRHWPAEMLPAFVEFERASFEHMPALDNALACARAYMRALSAFHEVMASRRRIYGRVADQGCGPDFWPAIARGLLAAHDAGMNRVLEMVRFTGEKPASQEFKDMLAVPVPAPQLNEFAFTSNVPVIGGVIAWARNAVHGIAGRWALRHIAAQQSEFNRLMLKSLELTNLRILELTLEIRDLVERQSTLQREQPADAGDAIERE